MIPKEELRINNWVYLNASSKEGKDFLPIKITRGSQIDNSDNLSPIELTEEILEACGFEREEGTHREWGKYYWFELKIDNHYKILCQNKTSAFESENILIEGIAIHYFNGDENNVCPIENIKYLHQLQNLFQSHINKELEIKEIPMPILNDK